MPSNQRSRFARAVHLLLYGVRWVLFMVLLYLRGLAFFVLEGWQGFALCLPCCSCGARSTAFWCGYLAA